MNETEIRNYVLNNPEIQHRNNLTAVVTSIEEQLIKKGMFTEQDIKEICEDAQRKVKEMNEAIIKETIEKYVGGKTNE